MTPIELDVLGIGAWSPTATSWPAWKAELAGRGATQTAPRPFAALLPPAERRRAPDGVLVALAVAQEALDAARTVACPVLGDAGVLDNYGEVELRGFGEGWVPGEGFEVVLGAGFIGEVDQGLFGGGLGVG